MSILSRAQVLPEDTASLSKHMMEAVLDWTQHNHPKLGERIEALRASKGLNPSRGAGAYDLFVAAPGTAFRKILGQVCTELASALDVRIDLSGWGSLKGQNGIIQTELPERFGDDQAPGLSVMLLQHSNATFEDVQEFASKHPDAFIVRRRRSMSQDVAHELVEIEKGRVRPIEREMKLGRLDDQILGALRVLGVQMGTNTQEHPFAVLSRQDPLLGALYLAAFADTLAAHPPLKDTQSTHTLAHTDQDQLVAVAYEGEYRMLDHMMTRRAVRGQYESVKLLEGKTPKDAITHCLARAEDLGLFTHLLSTLHKVDQVRSSPDNQDPENSAWLMSRLAHYYKDLTRSRVHTP